MKKFNLQKIMLKACRYLVKIQSWDLLNVCTEHGRVQKQSRLTKSALRMQKQQQALRKKQLHGVNGRNLDTRLSMDPKHYLDVI